MTHTCTLTPTVELFNGKDKKTAEFLTLILHNQDFWGRLLSLIKPVNDHDPIAGGSNMSF